MKFPIHTTGTIVINRGDISCADARAVVSKYYGLRADQLGGNAAHADFDGWHCSSPTAVSSDEQGVGTFCEKQSAGAQIRVVTEDGSLKPDQVALADYLSPGSDSSLVSYQFSAADGKWRCRIWQFTPKDLLAGCSGDMPTDAPDAQNPVSHKFAKPNGVQIGSSGAGEFVNSQDPKFWPSNESGGFAVGKDLPVGSSLSFYEITCTALENQSLECVNRKTNHGFRVSPDSHQLT